MIKFEFLVCSESLMKDAEKDSFSALNILEDYAVESYPAILNKISFLLITSRENEDPNKIEVKLEILNNEDIIFNRNASIKFLDKLKANLGGAIHGLMINNSGKLIFRFTYQNEKIEYVVFLKLRDNPTYTDLS